MKKFLITLIICILALSATTEIANADVSLNSAIRLYKSGNYVASYTALNEIVEKQPSNVLAHYYLAMSCAQIGKKSEAIDNYSKVLTLSDNARLSRYAMKGLNCLENPANCNDDNPGDTDLDRFIRRQYGNGFTDEVTNDYDYQRINELRRMINRGEDIPPSKFKEFKDYSSEVPTDDEIAQAVEVLKRAGLYDILVNNNSSELAFFNNNSSENDILNMMFLNNSAPGKGIAPEVIQSLITNQMAIGF